jgi:hypothetical protein
MNLQDSDSGVKVSSWQIDAELAQLPSRRVDTAQTQTPFF